MAQYTTDARGRLGRLVRLTLKELREILRDRRTILTLVLMPLLLYPVLSVALQQFLLSQPHPSQGPIYIVGFRNPEEGRFLYDLVKIGGILFDDQPGPIPEPDKPRFNSQVEDDPEQAVASGRVDVVLRAASQLPGRFESGGDLAVDLELLYREESPASREAANHVETAVRNVSTRFLTNRLKALSVTQRAEPIQTQRRSISRIAKDSTNNSILAVIPLILTLMTVTGAVYPAIDLTAGERERGTLEILVAAPIPRISVLFAKYVAVLVVALLTATANLAMMTITIQATPLRDSFGGGGLSPSMIAAVFALLLLFAAFYSAVLLVVTCTARSFKEAQAYLIPLMLLSLAPGLLCLMPSVELSGLLQVTPLANIVLLGRDLLTQKATGGATLAVVGSTALYAAAAIGVAARIFGAESVLYSSASGWGDLFRRARVPQPAPSITTAVVTLAVIFPLFFLLQGIGDWFPSLRGRLIVGGVVSLVAFGIIPSIVCWSRRVAITPWYQHPASILAWPGVLLLGLSLWALDHELIVAVAKLRGVDFGGLLERLASYASSFRELPVWLIVLLIAFVPAILEEFFFRGFLWSAVENEKGRSAAWVTTSIAFGVFHLIMPNPLAVERLIATTAMGFILGAVRMRTRSVLPGTILHILHNSAAVLIPYFSPNLQGVGPGQLPTSHLPSSWLAAAAISSLAGLLFIAIGRSRQSAASPVETG